MSKIVELVDSVVSALSSYGAVKDLAPIIKSENIQDSSVRVIGGPEVWVKQSRGATYLATYDVVVLVEGRVELQTTLETYLTLVEDIKKTVKALPVTEIVQATPYDQERLYTEQVFTTQITVRFKGFVS